MPIVSKEQAIKIRRNAVATDIMDITTTVVVDMLPFQEDGTETPHYRILLALYILYI